MCFIYWPLSSLLYLHLSIIKYKLGNKKNNVNISVMFEFELHSKGFIIFIYFTEKPYNKIHFFLKQLKLYTRL